MGSYLRGLREFLDKHPVVHDAYQSLFVGQAVYDEMIANADGLATMTDGQLRWAKIPVFFSGRFQPGEVEVTYLKRITTVLSGDKK